jgi:hypothetical protein
MYLTVQRVASINGERGINGALYVHRANRDDPMWSEPDIQQIASSNVGTQVARRTDIAPGGNSVECFLDIAFPDDYTEAELRTALARVRDRIASSRIELVQGPVAIAFSQNLGEGARALKNYDQLCRAAFQLFRAQANQVVESELPLDIVAAIDETGWHFELTDASKARIQSIAGQESLARVNVPLDVAEDFRQMYGELYPFVPEWVTGSSRDELAQVGGVRILRNGTVVWQWPRVGDGP